MIDISSDRIRRDIDRAYENGRRYTVIQKTGDDNVDAAVCKMVDEWGCKVAMNDEALLISWI